MATALHSTRTRFFDKCGKPLCGGTVHTYQASTTTAKPTYTDVNKTAVNTNPVILDSIGSAAIFLDGAYRVRVLDRNGVLVEDIAYIESWVSATEKDKIYENITTNKSLINTHINKLDNPHQVTKAQVGLGNVDNTADIDKPISNAVNNVLLTKADIADTYTKNETDNKISALSATTYAGHKGYLTLADAQAAQSTLAANTLVEVTNDSDSTKNGVYTWDGTTLTRSTFDPVAQAKNYTDKTVKQDSASFHTHKFVDANNNVMAAIDVEGGLYLVGLDTTVQEAVSSNKASIASVNTSLNNIAQPALDKVYTHKFVDANNNVMAAIDVEGGLNVVGLDTTVQEAVSSNKASIASVNTSLNNIAQPALDKVYTHKFVDANNNVMAAIDVEGGLYLVGLDGTVQSYLGKTNTNTQSIAITKDTTLAATRKKTDIFTADTQQVLDMQRYANINAAPAPLDLHKRIYTISNTWLDSIKFSRPASKTVIKTPYRNDDGVVHPHIIEFYNGFRGYRYLLKLEPYYNTVESYENPCVYGSNDLVNFTLLDGFTQPLANPPTNPYGTSHNSDGVFAYDPKSGDLILVFRETIRNYQGGTDTYDAWAMRKTKDGCTWTDKEYLLEPRMVGTGFNTASPAILYDPIKDEWHIYIGTGGGVQHYVKKDLNKDNWQLPTTIVTPSDMKAWHIDARYVGNKIVALVHDQTNGQFRFGVSSDFVNFVWSQASVYTEVSGEVVTDKYKASFVPKFNEGGQLAFTVLWTSRFDSSDISKRWNLFINNTNYVNAQVEFI